MSVQFNAELTAALMGFNGEADLYCQGISDTVAHGYAMSYAKMLHKRASGIDSLQPPIPHGLFEPNRNLIRSTLERMARKHFPGK